MINQADDWNFIKKPSRPALTSKQVHYWKQTLQKLLKVGIEVELNLPDKNGTCDKQNFLCQCVAIFDAPDPMPDTSKCYEQCGKWDNGNCDIAKKEGCAGINCVAFKQPCGSCSKYDRGCETCPQLYSIKKDPTYIRKRVTADLKPTNFVGALGENGIYKVCRDGSLSGDGGIEIATVGRRMEFDSVHAMVKKVMKTCEEHAAYTDERCSIHIHLLASYLTPGFSSDDSGSDYIKNEVTELEKPMPEVIIANFHQLIRRYHSALIWLSAAGKSHNQLTRWEKFRKSIIPYSAVRKRMNVLVNGVGSASKSKRKYAMMNYQQMRFNEEGDVSRLHVEGRYMDGNLSPATVTAHAALLYGLMLKAVEISRHGVLESGSKQHMDLQKEMYKNLCNNDGPWEGTRFSDTSNLGPYVLDLKRQSRQLIRLVKNTMSEQGPATNILSKLAEKPLAYSLMEDKDWNEIESVLMPESVEVGEVEDKILSLAELGAISGCHSSEEWVTEATNYLQEPTPTKEKKFVKGGLQELVASLTSTRKMYWCSTVGGYVSNR